MASVAQQFLEQRVRACVQIVATQTRVTVDGVLVDLEDAVVVDRAVQVVGDAEGCLVHVRVPREALEDRRRYVTRFLEGAVTRALRALPR